jgi:hypothetical protein
MFAGVNILHSVAFISDSALCKGSIYFHSASKKELTLFSLTSRRQGGNSQRRLSFVCPNLSFVMGVSILNSQLNFVPLQIIISTKF